MQKTDLIKDLKHTVLAEPAVTYAANNAAIASLLAYLTGRS